MFENSGHGWNLPEQLAQGAADEADASGEQQLKRMQAGSSAAVETDRCNRMFPYLDLSGLTHETLTSRLWFESKEIMFKFEHVKSVAMRSLMRRGVMVDELLSHLTILETFDPVKKEPRSPNCYTDVMNANTIPKVFIALSNYMSFFNYDILIR